MKIQELSNLFPSKKSDVLIFCDAEDIRKMNEDTKANTTSWAHGTFNMENKHGINCDSFMIEGRTIHLVDRNDMEKCFKLSFAQ